MRAVPVPSANIQGSAAGVCAAYDYVFRKFATQEAPPGMESFKLTMKLGGGESVHCWGTRSMGGTSGFSFIIHHFFHILTFYSVAAHL